MLKTVVEPVKILLRKKINKFGVKNSVVKKSEYTEKAREVWELIDKDFGISTTIENVLKLKIDKFEQVLIKKFPELNSQEIEKIKNSIIVDSNLGKTIELGKINALKQLQEITIKLKEENKKLKLELNKIKEVFPLGKDIKLKSSNEVSDEKK